MTEHTRTPWRVFITPDGRKLVGIGGLDGEGTLDAGFGVWAWNDAEGIANANFVVEAVNSHDQLKADLACARKALETAAARFNLMGGVGLVNGADPKVGYRECIKALTEIAQN